MGGSRRRGHEVRNPARAVGYIRVSTEDRPSDPARSEQPSSAGHRRGTLNWSGCSRTAASPALPRWTGDPGCSPHSIAWRSTELASWSPRSATASPATSFSPRSSSACYQPDAFCASDDVQVLLAPDGADQAAMMFVSVVLRRERYRYSFGRKWHLERMRETRIRLPSKEGRADWEYMSSFMRSLPFSSGALV